MAADREPANAVIAEKHHLHEPDCPCCHKTLNDNSIHRHTYTADTGETRHVLDCASCGARLTLVVYNPDPTSIEIWVTAET